MNYYDTNQMQEVIGQASHGDEAARAIIDNIAVPFAVSQDYSKLILVQEKHAFVRENGMVNVLNMPPVKGELRRYVADIYQCNEGWSLCSYIQIPSSFVVREIRYNNGVFSFISNDNFTVAGTLEQINRAMDVVFSVDGVTEAELEKCFFSIPVTIVDPDPPKKTAAENPPINDKIVGTVTFDEHLQLFESSYQSEGYSFNICINTDNRKKVMKMIRTVHCILTDLDAIDLKARKFAADELLKLKNEAWLDEDEEIVSKPEFISRMSIDTISFEDDGEIQIWYADGELFWGHSITVIY